MLNRESWVRWRKRMPGGPGSAPLMAPGAVEMDEAEQLLL